MKHKKAKGAKSKIVRSRRRAKSNPDTASVACSLLDNIAKRLDVCRASVLVFRVALNGQNRECKGVSLC